MSVTVQQDALLGKSAVLAYDNRSAVEAKLTSEVNFSGWIVRDSSTQGAFAGYAFENPATGQVVIAFRGTDGLGDRNANVALFGGKWDTQFNQASTSQTLPKPHCRRANRRSS